MNASQQPGPANSATSPNAGARIAVPPSAIANAVPAAGVRVPIELIGPYPMIRGSVNGQAGRFMLDVGTRMAVLLNSNRLNLGPSVRIGQGVAESGQPVVLHLHDNVERLEIWPGAVVAHVDWAHSANFGFVEDGIAEDFLGFIGTGILLPFEFTLDYADRSVFLSRLATDGTPLVEAYNDQGIVATLRFTTQNSGAPYEPILPIVDFALGGFAIPLGVDSGNPGGKLVLTPAVNAALRASGLLIPDGDHFSVVDLTYGESVISLRGIDVEEGTAQRGTLGYSLLSRFTTAWNYQTSTLKLIAPHN